MRTNIVIDDKLMEEVLRLTGAKTKREAVELGLKTLIRLKRQSRLHGFALGFGSCQAKDLFHKLVVNDDIGAHV